MRPEAPLPAQVVSMFSVRREVRGIDRRKEQKCGLNVNIIASVALNANMSNGEFQNLARYISSRVIVYDCFESTALTLHQA